MFPFNRQKKEEEPASEKTDDLKPVRKRRKKPDPSKAWGNLERLIVFVVLVSAPIFSIIFFAKSQTSPHIITPQILETFAPPTPKEVGSLKDQLTAYLTGAKGTYGIWIQAVDNSYRLGINETTQFDGASLFKLPLMIAYYRQLDKGKISPASTYILRYSDQAAGAGTLAAMPVGTAISYQDMIEAMGKSSDNTAFQIMTLILGEQALANTIQELDMQNTDFTKNQTTPYDIGLLFYKLTTSNIISKKSTQELLNFLKNTDFEQLIPAGLPDNIEVAHKYAAHETTLDDAGIIYAPKPFILIILAKNITLEEAQTTFPKLTQLVYDWAVK